MYPSLAALSSERLVLLFSPFRTRSLNPDHYDEKMKFWQLVIKEFSESEGKICFTMKEIEQKLMSQSGRKPNCLPEVFLNMTREGALVPYAEYVGRLSSTNSWLTWSAQTMKRVAATLWSYTPVASVFSKGSTDETTKFVHVPQLKCHVERIMSKSSSTGKVKSVEQFKKEISEETKLKDADLELVLKCLAASGRLATDSLRDEIEIVKLVPTPNSPGITQVEKGQFDIQRSVEALEEDLAKLTEKKDEAASLARTSLKAGKRATAKSHLRAQKLMEKRIDKLSNVLDTLTSIAIQIEGAESDAKVLKAYEVGKRTLHQVLRENNLTEDLVTDVMLDIKELLDEQEDISTSISQPIGDEDSSLMEKELEELMREEEEDKRREDRRKALDQGDVVKDLDNLTITGVEDFSRPEGTTSGSKQAVQL